MRTMSAMLVVVICLSAHSAPAADGAFYLTEWKVTDEPRAQHNLAVVHLDGAGAELKQTVDEPYGGGISTPPKHRYCVTVSAHEWTTPPAVLDSVDDPRGAGNGLGPV